MPTFMDRHDVPGMSAEEVARAGEPIVEGERFFGATVNLAARLCAAAEPGTVHVPAAVRELTLGKGFTYIDRGHTTLKGFSEPV